MTYPHQLATLLQEAGLLNAEQIAISLSDAKKQAHSFVSSVIKHNFLSSQKVLAVCIEHFNLPVISLAEFNRDLFIDTLEPALFDHYHALPFSRDQHSLQLAMSDPSDYAAIAAIRFHTGLSIYPVMVDEVQLEATLKKLCRTNQLGVQLKTALSRIPQINLQPDEADDTQDDEPVIQFVNQLLTDAIQKQASDIHIENFSAACRIRFRQDGLLHEVANLPPHFSARLITRIKIMADLDITEKRMPQDGRFRFSAHRVYDFRVSSCAALHGEKLVLRLLQPASQQLPLSAIGMTPRQLKNFQHALHQPQGLIIVSGPTGSGKTATLYAGLQAINHPDKNILTVEDPVEIEVHGITQVNVNHRIGLDFATILRAFLRQDPDVMMVGEIRDAETAAIAVHAAQTGHLVMATLHANSAADCVKRLMALGITACQLAGSLTLLVAQRLIRKRCPHCLGNQTVNCEQCHEGYAGRVGIFETAPISSCVTQLLLANAPLADIENQIRQENNDSLWLIGSQAVAAGVTTLIELQRVTGGWHEN